MLFIELPDHKAPDFIFESGNFSPFPETLQNSLERDRRIYFGKTDLTFLYFSPPDIGEEEIQEVLDTLRSDRGIPGAKTKRLEEDFAGFIAVGYYLRKSAAGIKP